MVRLCCGATETPDKNTLLTDSTFPALWRHELHFSCSSKCCYPVSWSASHTTGRSFGQVVVNSYSCLICLVVFYLPKLVSPYYNTFENITNFWKCISSSLSITKTNRHKYLVLCWYVKYTHNFVQFGQSSSEFGRAGLDGERCISLWLSSSETQYATCLQKCICLFHCHADDGAEL